MSAVPATGATLAVREADVPNEIDRLERFHNANRETRAAPGRFRWAYLENPAGPARAWVAEEPGSGELVGLAVLFPRRLRMRGLDRIVWIAGDLSVSRPYRGRGLASTLRYASRTAIDDSECPFFYTFPNDQSVGLHLRAGHRLLGRMRRYFKLLRLPVRGERLAAASALLLSVAGFEPFARISGQVDWMESVSGREFDELYATLAPRLGLSLVRDAAYLDWRYLRNPADPGRLLVIRSGGRVRGYLAYSIRPRFAVVKDWLAESGRVWAELFAAFIREMRRQSLEWISSSVLDGHPDVGRLVRFGFVPRLRTGPVVAYAAPHCAGRAELLTARAWYMTAGDRDV